MVERLAADGRDVWPRLEPDRFRPVMTGLYENTRALPRAFLVRRARQVPAEQMLEQLRDLDPVEEVLMTESPPAGFTGGPAIGAPAQAASSGLAAE